MSKSTTPPEQPPIRQLQTVLELLETPSLARIYSYVCLTEDVPVEELISTLEVPQGTVYDYVNRLEDAGLLQKTRTERPYRFDAEPLSVTVTIDGDQQTISAELVDAVGRSDENQDISVYLDRHGIDGLATALEYAREYVGGTVNHRIMARELDLSSLEAEIILQALEPVVRAHRADE
ncbi:TrmB family transcriptional regulator [Natronolimnobius sp. AArcel1]|uniref:winged helix-turn-helix domain-containing protein n=1 Tax=Natronolimnobius sp. AArcel1 TaxID=1679093 RepID=UPI0013ECFF5A|nr:helix-turn-helix domain-containing protein [Natronolimnobius sp. AArcel1]NGM69098.1 TrmB family transcriptional regulator [Natronolimnobius sp. AArcel1]